MHKYNYGEKKRRTEVRRFALQTRLPEQPGRFAYRV
jgi:hypothetical protein